MTPDGETDKDPKCSSTQRRVSTTTRRDSHQRRERTGRFSLRRFFGRSKTYKGENKPDKAPRSGKSGGETVVICPVCFVVRPRSMFPEISTCEHRSCIECLKQYMTIPCFDFGMLLVVVVSLVTAEVTETKINDSKDIKA